MLTAHRNKIIRWSMAIAGLSALVVLFIYLVPRYIERKVGDRLANLGAMYQTIEVSLMDRSLRVRKLHWKSEQDSLAGGHEISLHSIRFKGIHLVDLIFNKELTTNHLQVDSGVATFSRKSVSKSSPGAKTDFTNFYFQKIVINQLVVNVLQDTSVIVSTHLTGQFTSVKLKQDTLFKNTVRVNEALATLSNVRLFPTNEMYGVTINKLLFDSRQGTLMADSGLLIPLYEKYEFARKLGTEVARINLFIPRLYFEGIVFDQLFEKSFIAKKLTVEAFDLFVFKDKRIPFLRTNDQPLPMVSFATLPFDVMIDSIDLTDGHLRVEQILKGDIQSGTIRLTNINSTLSNLSNRAGRYPSKKALLVATATLMDQGQIDAQFTFPTDGSGDYDATGSVSNLNFTALNPILENMADVRVESGFLKQMSFHFTYNDLFSKGTLDITYENLKLTGLHKNKKSTNQLKTVLLQIMMKRDIRKSSLLSNRGGVIDVERDRKRYVFNLWLISIADGLQSSMIGRPPRRPPNKHESD